MRFASSAFFAALFVAFAAPVALAADSGADASAISESAMPESTVPEALLGFVGDFILAQEDESLPICPLRLTDQQVSGGWAAQLPETCPAPYPAADALAAWNIDDSDGSILLLNAAGEVTMRLLEDEDGLYDTAAGVEPRFYFLTPYDAEGAGGEADAID